MPSAPRRRCSTTPGAVRVAAVLAVLLSALLGAASHAHAHAYVQTSSPEEGAVLTAPPDEVRVTFDDDVRAPLDALKVYDLDSQRVDLDNAVIDPTDDRTVVGHVSPDLPPGTYVVTWRAISLDDHTILGSWTFAIVDPTAGAPSAADAVGVAAVVAGEQAGSAVALPMAFAARSVTLVAVLLLAGAGVVGLVLLRDAGPGWRTARAQLRRRLRPLATLAAAATVTDLFATTTAQAGVGTGAAVAAGAFDHVLLSTVGLAGLARLLLLVPGVAGADLRHTAPAPTAVVLVGPALTLAVDGHPLAEVGLLGVGADAVHLLAAAVWFGGLVAVAAAIATRDPAEAPAACAGMLARFSTLAAASLAAIAVTGTALAVALHGVTGPAGLLASPHGRLLGLKVVLVAGAVGLGLANRRLLPHLVAPVAGGAADLAPSPTAPALRLTTPAGSTSAGSTSPGGTAWRRVRRTLVAEVVILLVVVLVAARLAETATATAPAAASAVVATFEDGTTAEVVLRHRPGDGRAVLETRFTTPPDEGADLVARLEHLPTGAVIERSLVSADATTHAALLGDGVLPGDWRVQLRLGVGRFDLFLAEVVTGLTVDRSGSRP